MATIFGWDKSLTYILFFSLFLSLSLSLYIYIYICVCVRVWVWGCVCMCVCDSIKKARYRTFLLTITLLVMADRVIWERIPKNAIGLTCGIFLVLFPLLSFWGRGSMYSSNFFSGTGCYAKTVFETAIKWFEFGIFLLLDWLPYQSKRNQYPFPVDSLI